MRVWATKALEWALSLTHVRNITMVICILNNTSLSTGRLHSHVRNIYLPVALGYACKRNSTPDWTLTLTCVRTIIMVVAGVYACVNN
mmetsp:Transcript_66542/g.178067  ORF Transcript_66542/g.178067 Transcript_66542/m.178067 type:complete len:87 (-) Transcript_66542:107-367(-)